MSQFSFSEATGRFPPMGEVRLVPGETALLLIDLQYLDASPDHGVYGRLRREGKEELCSYFISQLPRVVRNSRKLLEACRAKGLEILYTRIGSLTPDGRDLSPSYREKGFHAPPDSVDAEVLEELSPRPDEIVLTKSSTSPFTSTHIDQLLRYLGIRSLICCGVHTNYCVETTVRDAYDRGYGVVLAGDACASLREDFHQMALAVMDQIFCHVLSTGEVLERLGA
ncbi:cysteine hydrolase family protein [Nitrospinota bacterium]